MMLKLRRVIDAFGDTLHLAVHGGLGRLDRGAELAHMEKMLDEMKADEFFRLDKANRWLGWAQGWCCAKGYLTVDQCREINRRNIG